VIPYSTPRFRESCGDTTLNSACAVRCQSRANSHHTSNQAPRRLRLLPDTCLVTESAESGVATAKAARARCLGLTTSFTAEQLESAGAGWVVEDLASAPASALDWSRNGRAPDEVAAPRSQAPLVCWVMLSQLPELSLRRASIP
jgi:hypothetical protein